MKKESHLIKYVDPDGIASEMGVEPGMSLLSINDTPVQDIFDYRYLMSDTHVDVLMKDLSGNEVLLEIDKDLDEDFGVTFDSPLMDDYKRCANNCIFCFIDQMPKGMRGTLYFKDDDLRLSFLQGNYATLTNMSDADVERICRYKMEPINISVQTTNPKLRCRMLRNKRAGESLKKIDTFKDAGIIMNGQIVLCKHWNDGNELDRTLSDLEKVRPQMQSVSVVPVGLTQFRGGLTTLLPFTTEDARDVIGQINRHPHFAYASDEWYLLAGEKIPEADYYDGYPQLENGVGMLRSLIDEAEDAIRKREETNGVEMLRSQADEAEDVIREKEEIKKREPGEYQKQAERKKRRTKVTVACGKLFEPSMKKLALKVPELNIQVIGIRNDFFGTGVTVSGLLTGQDLIRQLSGKSLGKRLLITVNMLRSGERVFLDDMTVDELEEKLGIPVFVTGQSGYDLIDALYGIENEDKQARQVYEQDGTEDLSI